MRTYWHVWGIWVASCLASSVVRLYWDDMSGLELSLKFLDSIFYGGGALFFHFMIVRQR